MTKDAIEIKLMDDSIEVRDLNGVRIYAKSNPAWRSRFSSGCDSFSSRALAFLLLEFFFSISCDIQRFQDKLHNRWKNIYKSWVCDWFEVRQLATAQQHGERSLFSKKNRGGKTKELF